MKSSPTLELTDSGFQRIEQKIEDIQTTIDHGISFGDESGAIALSALRGARVKLFALRSILRDCVCVTPPDSPHTPDVA